MRGIAAGFVGDVDHFSFEERIFNFTMLLGIFMTLFGTIMDVYYGAAILPDLFFVGCWILTYYLSRFRGYFTIVSAAAIVVLVFAFIPYCWIFSGGSSSIIPYYTIAFITIISILLKGKFRIIMVLSMLAVELFLIFRDAYIAGSLNAVVHANIHISDFLIHLMVLMTAMAVMIIVYSNTYMAEKARSEKYARTIEEQYRQQVYSMVNLEELICRLKSERHDFNNHLGVIYGLLEGGETGRAKEYASRLVKNAVEYQNIANIPYTTVRAMLNYKLSAARESGIRPVIDIKVPEGLKFNEFDLTVILGNLLDNSIEACSGMPAGDRYISLGILYKPDYLIIRIENPVHPDRSPEEGLLHTTKPDAENHGFGLRNIEYLVNKHNGLMKMESEHGSFRVDIAFLVDI